MELIMSMKGSKYIVQDKAQARQIYSVKKKGFGAGRYVLLDASNYQLYSLMQASDERKPVFVISHNDVSIMQLVCKSLFLDPTINVEGKDIQGAALKFDIASKDHKNFELIKDGTVIGSINTKMSATRELMYDITIDNKYFDDYFPLFALAVDLTFGDMNRGQ